MRHIFGFLVCLAFVFIAMTYIGVYDRVYTHSDRVQASAIGTLETAPLVGAFTRRAVRWWVNVVSPNPIVGPVIYLAGNVFSVALSPVGAIALGLYWLLLWIFLF
jgi:hypothetical protein